MVQRLPFLFFLLISTAIAAQTDSLPAIGQRIADARLQLLVSLQANDLSESALWRDSLLRFGDTDHAGLVWDEQWLLYFWEGTYGNLFDEVVRFDETERQRLADKVQPPKDHLFEWLDSAVYDRRFELYENIGRGFLTEEEKQFALIELDYLLRLNQQEQASGEWKNRLEAFLKRYPESRFQNYIRSNLYNESVTGKSYQSDPNRGFTIDLLFASGRWRNNLETTMGSPYGFDLGISYWQRRWSLGLRCTFGWEKLSRPVFQDGFEWPKDDPTVLIIPSLEIGYDILNNQKIRLFPAIGAGISILKPPGTTEETDNPPPDYYSNFFYAKGCWGGSLNADIKLKNFDVYDTKNAPDNSNLCIRLRVGYNRLFWGKENPALQGDMFFFAVGVNIFGHVLR